MRPPLRHTTGAATAAQGFASLLGWACAGGLAATVFFAPAHWFADALARATDGRAQLLEARGTVWRGSGVLVLTGGQGSTQSSRLPQRLGWTIGPQFSGGIGLAASASAQCCGDQAWQALVQPRWGGFDMQVRAPAWRLPAQLLQGLGTPWNTLGLQGQLLAQSEGLSIKSRAGRFDISGKAQLDILDARSKLSTLAPIGSYRLNFQGAGAARPTPSVALTTLQGALALTGDGQWAANRFRFLGRAAVADPQHEAALQNILNIVGRRDGASSIITIG